MASSSRASSTGKPANSVAWVDAQGLARQHRRVTRADLGAREAQVDVAPSAPPARSPRSATHAPAIGEGAVGVRPRVVGLGLRPAGGARAAAPLRRAGYPARPRSARSLEPDPQDVARLRREAGRRVGLVGWAAEAVEGVSGAASTSRCVGREHLHRCPRVGPACGAAQAPDAPRRGAPGPTARRAAGRGRTAPRSAQRRLGRRRRSAGPTASPSTPSRAPASGLVLPHVLRQHFTRGLRQAMYARLLQPAGLLGRRDAQERIGRVGLVAVLVEAQGDGRPGPSLPARRRRRARLEPRRSRDRGVVAPGDGCAARAGGVRVVGQAVAVSAGSLRSGPLRCAGSVALRSRSCAGTTAGRRLGRASPAAPARRRAPPPTGRPT